MVVCCSWLVGSAAVVGVGDRAIVPVTFTTARTICISIVTIVVTVILAVPIVVVFEAITRLVPSIKV